MAITCIIRYEIVPLSAQYLQGVCAELGPYYPPDVEGTS